jgi:hypothetical protein
MAIQYIPNEESLPNNFDDVYWTALFSLLKAATILLKPITPETGSTRGRFFAKYLVSHL